MRLFMILQITSVVLVLAAVEGRVLDFEQDLGGIADDLSEEAAWFNGGLLNSTLPTLEPGDTFFVPNKGCKFRCTVKCAQWIIGIG